VCRGGRGRRQEEQKGPSAKLKLRVTLEDIYNGKEIPVINREIAQWALGHVYEAGYLPPLQGEWG